MDHRIQHDNVPQAEQVEQQQYDYLFELRHKSYEAVSVFMF